MIDTLKLAKEQNPGKKASLNALCSFYEIDNTHRALHGALLDAELLADVYLAMTRGQESLIMMLDEPAPQQDDADAGGGLVERLPLRVLRATDEELAGHDKVLGEIAKANKGHCLWIPPEPRAGRLTSSVDANKKGHPDRAALFAGTGKRSAAYGTSGSALPRAVVLKPPSTYMISPVMPLARSEHRKAAALPTSSMVTLRRSGALCSLNESSLPKLPMPDAARVLIGPAEMALTRVPSGPRVTAM